jgi:hypothetical protein
MRLAIAGALGLLVPSPPPVIEPVSDLVIEATSSAGAVVIYASPATLDAADGPGVAACAPASGATFPLGVTTVTCVADDVAGQTSFMTFTIAVRDTTAPVIEEIADISAEATSAAGVSVTYASPGTTDAVDAPGVASCVPVSGDIFPLGETVVTCTTEDSAGNSSSRTFDVAVREAEAPVIAEVVVPDTTPPAIVIDTPTDVTGDPIAAPATDTVIAPPPITITAPAEPLYERGGIFLAEFIGGDAIAAIDALESATSEIAPSSVDLDVPVPPGLPWEELSPGLPDDSAEATDDR